MRKTEVKKMVFGRQDFLGVCPECGTPLALHKGCSNPNGELSKATSISCVRAEGYQRQIRILGDIKKSLMENPKDFIAEIDKTIRRLEEAMGEDMALDENWAVMKEKHSH